MRTKAFATAVISPEFLPTMRLPGAGSGAETREPRALIRDADIAMTAAQDQGRDRAVVFEPSMPWIVQSALAQAGASPGWLTLEVTESHLVADTAALLERLHALRALGVQIPLDDPDRSPGLAAAVVEIGRAIGMATIAEGIETDRQLERLRAMGCRLGQGFLLGRPLAPDAILALIGEPATRPAGVTERAIAAA